MYYHHLTFLVFYDKLSHLSTAQFPLYVLAPPFPKTKAKTNKFKRYWVYPFEAWREFVTKKQWKEMKKKVGKKRVWNDKYSFEACATGCYALRQYCYWGSLLSILAIQKGSLC